MLGFDFIVLLLPLISVELEPIEDISELV